MIENGTANRTSEGEDQDTGGREVWSRGFLVAKNGAWPNRLARMAGIKMVGSAATADEAASSISQVRPEIVFIEPQKTLQGELRRLGHSNPTVVLATDETYALDAFASNVTDYVTIAQDDARLQLAVDRCRQQLLERPGRGSESAGKETTSRLIIRTRAELHVVQTTAIKWIEAEGDYVVLHCDDVRYRTRRTLKTLEQQLDPLHFYRVGRNAIVNLTRLRKINLLYLGDYSLELNDGTKIPLNRVQLKALKERLAFNDPGHED